MNKENCNIIKDLLPSYIEMMVSKDSKVFIEQHIANCVECKEVLNKMNSQILIENAENQSDDIIERDTINKVRKKIKMHAKILFYGSIIICILVLMLIFSRLYTYNFLKNVYEKYSQINQSNNYRLTVNTIYKNYEENEDFTNISELYYKDGKYKEIIYDNYNKKTPQTIILGEINSNEKTIIDYQNKKINKRKNSTIYYKTGQLIKNDFVNSYCLPEIRYLYILNNVENRQFIGKDCYVYNIKSEFGYTEYWIEKDTLINIRTVESYQKYYRETLYIFEENIVNENDIQNNYILDNFDYSEIETNDMTENIEDINLYINELLEKE